MMRHRLNNPRLAPGHLVVCGATKTARFAKEKPPPVKVRLAMTVVVMKTGRHSK